MSQFFKVKPYCNSIHLLLGLRRVRLGASFFAVFLALGAGQASANPPDHANNMGPRASVSAATVCAIDGSDFTVEIRVYDKTSGDAIARVTEWSIDALAKIGPGNWDNQEKFAGASMSGLSLPVPTTIGPVSFSLCVLQPPSGAYQYYAINPVVEEAKGLNAMAATTYGRLNQDTWVVEDQRTIMNMCSDDTETLDVVEPSGIKLTSQDIELIAAACAALPPVPVTS